MEVATEQCCAWLVEVAIEQWIDALASQVLANDVEQAEEASDVCCSWRVGVMVWP